MSSVRNLPLRTAKPVELLAAAWLVSPEWAALLLEKPELRDPPHVGRGSRGSYSLSLVISCRELCVELKPFVAVP